MEKETANREIEILIERYPCLSPLRERLCRCVDMLAESYRRGGKLLVCGNGGSAADSLHIVGELMKGFVLDRRIPQELQAALMERYPNEAPYYIQNLQAAFPSISLVSETALMTAYSNDQGVKVVALTGQGGGELAALSDILLDVPSCVTYQIQELHLPVYHALCLALERELFD